MTATNDGFTCTTQTFDYRELPTATTHGVDPATCTGTGQDTVTHTYDGLGRLVRDEQGSLRSIDDTFDAVRNRLRSAPVSANSSGTTTTITTDFDVNVVDQVVSETRTEDTTIRMSKTTYDPAWNPVDRCRWEAGATVGECEPGGSGGTNPPSHVSTTYDARNQRIKLTDSATATGYLWPSLESGNLNLKTDVRNGMGYWNNQPARNPFYHESTTGTKVNVHRTTTSLSNIWAEAYTYSNSSNVVTSAMIRFNPLVTWNRSYTYSTYKADARKVATHELGHTQALGHTGFTAVMKADPINVHTPQTNDTQGLQAIYGAP